MGSNRIKQTKKSAATGFDQAALTQLTAELDTTLPSEIQREPKTKRKRPREAEQGTSSKKQKATVGKTSPRQRWDRNAGKPPKGATNDALLEEILALGGNEEDYELIANVESGSEDEPPEDVRGQASINHRLDESLQDELSKFASTLGFQRFSVDIDFDTDTQEDADDDDIDDNKHSENGTGDSTPAAETVETRRLKHSGKLIFDPRPDWHGASTDMDSPPSTVPDRTVNRHLASIGNLKLYADELLELDTSAYNAMHSYRSSEKFMSTIMTSGTFSDKVSALTLSIRESPLHSRKGLETLINLAAKKSRGQAIAALEALVDLLGEGMVLPSHRRLRPFATQPGLLTALSQSDSSTWDRGQPLPGGLSKSQLMIWAYEDWLKASFFRVMQLLEVWSSDEIEYSRSRALDFIFGLLRSKPEQEANLLRLLVNKLGDRERKISSRASHLLLQLLNVHPGMKAVVISAVEQDVILKPGQSLRAKYYAINTLNQTILSSKEPSVADNLLRMYFEIFLSLLKTGRLGDLDPASSHQKADDNWKRKTKHKSRNSDVPGHDEETTQKLVSSLLTGVNRAIPFTASDESTLEKHLDTLFRITHSSNFNTSVQALMLIQQLAASKHLAVERFYRTLYESLLDPRLVTSSKQALYLNLLYRAMKNDADVRRVKAFVKRLIQILGLHQPPFACGILFLVAEIEGTFPDLHALLTVPEDNDEDGEETFRDATGDSTAATAVQEKPAVPAPRASAYDGRKRDPEHSNAHRSCLWEIVPFFKHFHPSVGVFAANLLHRQEALPKPDLANHTLMHFLDKFVYRNPKATDTKRGGSIMQPIVASGSASHVVVPGKAGARQQQMVNSASFWNLKAEDVAAEDTFFHEYFARVGKPSEEAKVKKLKVDAGGSDDEGEEDEIWEALVNSRPDVEGEEESDGPGMDMVDYEDSDGEHGLDGDVTAGMSDFGSDESGDFEGIFDDSEDGDVPESVVEEPEDVTPGTSKKKRLSRSEMRSLPTFASADDYAEMLAAEEDGI